MGKRRMDSDLHRIKLDKGTVYQTSKGGNYYFRYQVKGERKCVTFICLLFESGRKGLHSFDLPDAERMSPAASNRRLRCDGRITATEPDVCRPDRSSDSERYRTDPHVGACIS